MKRLYLLVAGNAGLNDFWHMTPRELIEWTEAKTGTPYRDELDISVEDGDVID